jgi:hypothetical protein
MDPLGRSVIGRPRCRLKHRRSVCSIHVCHDRVWRFVTLIELFVMICASWSSEGDVDIQTNVELNGTEKRMRSTFDSTCKIY